MWQLFSCILDAVPRALVIVGSRNDKVCDNLRLLLYRCISDGW